MCGIAGVVGFEDIDLNRRLAGLMTDAIAHRGPDAEGIFAAPLIGLGHRRLSIIDLSEAANQPFHSSSGRYTIVYNGEIYNYSEVREVLEDYAYRTSSDTETVLAAYEQRGPDCLELLNGMFAFAIWDHHLEEMFIARDRVGVKPLYYHVADGGKLIFGSELRTILSSGLVRREISEESFYNYILYQSVYCPDTIVKGVHQLPPGTYGYFRKGRLDIKRYWRIDEPPKYVEPQHIESVHFEVRARLEKSISLRMVSDVRVAAFLSGGIDSSAVVALMSEASDLPIETYSVGFDEPEFDESGYAQLIADRFRTRHQTVRLTADDFLAELPNALAAVDAPSGDGLNTYVVSKAVHQAGVKVALSGLGGDELFAGYGSFRQFRQLTAGTFARVPAALRRPVGAAAALSRNSKTQRIAELLKLRNVTIANIYPLLRQVMPEEKASRLANLPRVETTIQLMLEDIVSNIKLLPILSQVSVAELLGFTLNVLLKDTDQFSMANALEVREPFFDYRLIEYVLQIPDKFKYSAMPKSLLVDSLSPLLPDKIVHRKKMGFVVPYEQWMKGPLLSFCDSHLKRLIERDLVNEAEAKRLWSDFLRGSGGVLWSHLWHLVVLSDWLERNEF